MAIEKKQETHDESQIGLTNQISSHTNKERCFLVLPQTTFDSLRSPSSSTDAIITIDNDEDETLESKDKKRDNLDSPTFNSLDSLPSTNAIINNDDVEELILEPKKEKPRLRSWWDDVDAFNELGSVVKGLPKKNDDVDAFNELGSVVKGLLKKNDDYDGESRVVDSCFSSTDPHEKDDERSVSSTHHDNFIELREDKSVRESTSSGNKGHRHVSLEDLGVSVEDLKNMPWEAFDPTWEIRSETMDPWLGGYVKDLLSPHH